MLGCSWRALGELTARVEAGAAGLGLGSGPPSGLEDRGGSGKGCAADALARAPRHLRARFSARGHGQATSFFSLLEPSYRCCPASLPRPGVHAKTDNSSGFSVLFFLCVIVERGRRQGLSMCIDTAAAD